MKALKIIFIVLIALAAVVAALSFIMPTAMKSERSIVIKAPKAVIFEQVRLLSNTQKWSPWAEKDPNMKTGITGTDGTVGAMYSWEGNDDVGKGEQTITKIEDQQRVDVKLHFIKPWESEANSYIILADDPGGVKVSWGFDGKMPHPWNVLSLFTNMDKTIGKDFEKGLAKLKALAEKEGAAAMASMVYEIKESVSPPHTYVGIRKEVSFDKISQTFSEYMPKIFGDLVKAGDQPSGAPVGLYYSWDSKSMKTDMAVAVPIRGDRAKVASWRTFEVRGGKTLTMDFYGSYDKVGNAHNQMDKYIVEKKYKVRSPVMEEYVTDPSTQPDTTKWLTRIYYFVE